MLGKNVGSANQLRDRIEIRISGFFAYAACVFYLGFRIQTGAFPSEIDALLNSRAFEIFFAVSLIVSITAGIGMMFYLRYQRNVFSMQDQIEEIRSQKLSYYLPFKYTLLFIAVVEFYLSLN